MEEMNRSGDGWEGWIGGMAPVQGRGTVDGRPWHFYARGSGWGVSIAERMEDDPDEVGIFVAGWLYEGEYGVAFDASGMPLDVAWGFVSEAIQKLRSGSLPLVEATQTKHRP